jgi:hypothetical protein
MDPLLFVIVMPVPGDKFANVNPVPFPIRICPFVGAAVTPVPPLATGTVPSDKALLVILNGLDAEVIRLVKAVFQLV